MIFSEKRLLFYKKTKSFSFLFERSNTYLVSFTDSKISFVVSCFRKASFIDAICVYLSVFCTCFNLHTKKTDLNMHFYQDGVDLTEVKNKDKSKMGKKKIFFTCECMLNY